MAARRRGKSERYFARARAPSDVVYRTASRGHVASVIAVVSEVCAGGGKALSLGDDLASDVLAKLWRDGGFAWTLSEVRGYATASVHNLLRQMRASKTKAFADHEIQGDEGETFLPFELKMVAAGDPYTSAVVAEAFALLRHLPKPQAQALGILCDGGSPIDVAVEMKMDLRDAILLIKEAQRNIHLVANDDDL